MRDAGARRRCRHADRDEQVAFLERRLVGAALEVGHGQHARGRAAAPHDGLGARRQQERGRIGVGIGEAEVAPERPRGAHADVRDRPLHLGERRDLLAYELGALDLAVRDGGADLDDAVHEPDPAQLRNAAHVDEMAVRAEAELEQEQQLGAARDRDRVVAVAPEDVGRLLERGRAVQVERRQRHAAAFAPRQHRERRLDARADVDARSEVGEALAEGGDARRRD